MSGVRFPKGWKIELLKKSHNRRAFESGNADVDSWFRASALQSQKKRLTTTKTLLDDSDKIVGFYSLAMSQVDITGLPADITKNLPQRQLPVAVLAWFGIDLAYQGVGLGKRLLATALRDCHDSSQTFAFIAVVLDCIDRDAKAFYRQFDFTEMPGHPMRLFLPAKLLEKMMT